MAPQPATATVILRRAIAADLDFIHAAERGPGYERLVGQWSMAEHSAALARQDTCYLIGRRAGQAAEGFVILQPLADVHEGAKLKRIVVTEPGRGFGRDLLAAVIDWVFRETANERLWLDVFTYNERAQHVYRSLGLREDGLLRAAYRMPDGTRTDRLLMSILRAEWPLP